MKSDWYCGTLSLDQRAIVESSVCEEPKYLERKRRDVVEQSLDRVAFGFVTLHRSDRDGRDDKWFGSIEDESSELAMALRGAIAWFGVAEFASTSVWTAMVVDVNEVEADDPRARAEDHRRLLSEEVVDGGFEVISWNGVQLYEGVIVGVGSTSGVGDSFDGLPIDSALQKRLIDNP